MKVGVISDTHGLLRPEVAHLFAGVSHIIHAGDIGAEHVVEGLRQIAPVTAIRGNIDSGDWTQNYCDTETVRLGRHVFYIVHDVSELQNKPAPDGIDAVIYGHSHRASVRTIGGVLYLNPGSAGPRRFKLPITLATLDLDDRHELRPVIHTLGRT